MTLSQWVVKDKLFPEAQAHALRAIAEGKSDKEIARERGISIDGSRNILRRIREKWGIKKRSALVAEAIRRGIIAPSTPVSMVIVFIASLLFSVVETDLDVRRTHNRISSRTTSNRVLRARRDPTIDVDFEFSDISPENLIALFKAQNQNTLAPWTSIAGTRSPISNSTRLAVWKLRYEEVINNQSFNPTT